VETEEAALHVSQQPYLGVPTYVALPATSLTGLALNAFVPENTLSVSKLTLLTSSRGLGVKKTEDFAVEAGMNLADVEYLCEQGVLPCKKVLQKYFRVLYSADLVDSLTKPVGGAEARLEAVKATAPELGAADEISGLAKLTAVGARVVMVRGKAYVAAPLSIEAFGEMCGMPAEDVRYLVSRGVVTPDEGGMIPRESKVQVAATSAGGRIVALSVVMIEGQFEEEEALKFLLEELKQRVVAVGNVKYIVDEDAKAMCGSSQSTAYSI
jgi:hypothetical protein